jgi:hypothetical protein
MLGTKHLIECRCILPTLKNKADPPLHKFIVFSLISDDDRVVEKIVNCNNCGVSHKVIDICQSEIIKNMELSKAAMTIEDVALMIPESVKSILHTYNKALPDYEHTKFIIEHERVGEFVVLSSETLDGKKAGKVLHYQGEGKFIIEPYQIDELAI